MRAGWDDSERAALVALLRARPKDMKWPEILVAVGERASALAVWHELFPATLLDDGTKPPELSEAASDIAGWQAAGYGL